MRQLGQGHYGKVHQGLWIGKVPVAIKSLKPGKVIFKNIEFDTFKFDTTIVI